MQRDEATLHRPGIMLGHEKLCAWSVVTIICCILFCFRWNAYGDLIHSAILGVVEKGVKTADVGGEHSTTDFLECLKEEIGQMARVGGME